MTVGELIQQLQQHDPDALVTRGDADWSNLKVTTVERVCAKDEGERHLWEVYDLELPPDEDEVRVWVVKIN